MPYQISDPAITYAYHLDGEDRVAWVSSAWLVFAQENGATQLTEEKVRGRSVYDFISGAETRVIYKELFTRARKAGQELAVPFRCDAPDCRRFMQLRIVPQNNDSIQIFSELVEAEGRPEVAVMRNQSSSSDNGGDGQLLRMCSWCKRVELDEVGWQEIEDAVTSLGLLSGPPPPISHGICPRCRATFEDEYGLDLNA